MHGEKDSNFRLSVQSAMTYLADRSPYVLTNWTTPEHNRYPNFDNRLLF